VTTPVGEPPRDWGTVRIARRDVPIRAIVVVALVAVWLALMLFATRVSGLVALWTVAAFFVPLLLIGSLTRTVPLRLLGWLILMGGFAMAVAFLGGALFSVFIKTPTAPLRAFVIPPLEEILKLAPVLYIVWRRRRSGTWTFGATDLLLMGAASGLGFGVVEHAYVANSRFGWPGHIGLLPITEILGTRLIVGHAIWTAIAGATVGFGLMLRHRPRLAILVGISGIAWTTLDHIGTNAFPVGRDSPSAISTLLTKITANGWLSLWIFLALVVATIVIDSVLLWRFPRLAGLSAPPLSSNARELASAWAFRVHKRALAYTFFRAQHSPPGYREEVTPVVHALVAILVADVGDSSAPPPTVPVPSP
jgi:RsiW-degrading membrane proteinase PrsW (M82 family)